MEFSVDSFAVDTSGKRPRVKLTLRQGATVRRYNRIAPKLLAGDKSNTKLAKALGTGHRIKGLSMSPHKVDGLLGNLCPHAGECVKTCLDGMGLGGVFLSIHAGRVIRRILWTYCREWFLEELANELTRQRGQYGVRLNVFQDVPWEKFLDLESFPRCQFYDYTKDPKRAGQLADNYWVTFSKDEKNQRQALAALASGRNVAVAFNVPKKDWPALQFPKLRWHGFPVIDGDAHDMRYLDPKGGHVVALRFKARTLADRALGVDSGFAVDKGELKYA